jgi:septum formation protein
VPELVLASTSPYRRALLQRLGMPFRCCAPEVDEEALKSAGAGLAPGDLARTLARAKAQSVAAIEPDAAVVGSDQLVAFEGQVFGKPGDAARAVDQLLTFAGKAHELITTLAVVSDGRTFEHTDVTTLWMRPLTRAEAERYVARERPLDCAGSYKLEEGGITLFERIDSRDHTAVTGLPLIALTTILRDLGFAIP